MPPLPRKESDYLKVVENARELKRMLDDGDSVFVVAANLGVAEGAIYNYLNDNRIPLPGGWKKRRPMDQYKWGKDSKGTKYGKRTKQSS